METDLHFVGLTTSSLDAAINRGFWVNRSLGLFLGATLTLSHRNGDLLIAFLALYVNASGRAFWKLVRCLLHFKGSSRARPDGIYLQRQATLRNSNLALDAVVQFLDIWRVWRKKVRRTHQRTLDAASIALFVASTVIVAGIFSSRLSRDSNEVLIAGNSTTCNLKLKGVSLLNSNDTDVQEYIAPFLNQKSAEHLAYAQRCYRAEPKPKQRDDGFEYFGHLPEKDWKKVFPDDCGILTIPTLPYITKRNASCPFVDGTCKSQYGNVIIETEELHSYRHFGLNKGPPFTMRVTHHCAPLAVNATETTNEDLSDVLQYHLGARENNLTFEIKDDSRTSALSHRGNYVVYAVREFEENSTHGKRVPFLKEYLVENAATTMLFLVSSSVNHAKRTDDPWFSATNPTEEPTFESDHVVSVVGCATQREYCNPARSRREGCVQEFQPRIELEAKFTKAWENHEDQKYLRPLAMTLHQFGAGSIGAFFEARNVPNLLARQTLKFPPVTYIRTWAVQTRALPSNQWQEEMIYLSQANFAAMQHYLVDFARGAWLGGALCDVPNSGCERLCYSQRVRSSRHYSFSVLWMSVTLILGGIVQFMAFFLDELLVLLFKFRRLRNDEEYNYAYAEWQAGSILQLQRLAQEGVGVGTWTGATDLVPVTVPGETLAVLDLREREHPRLALPGRELEHFITEDSVRKRPSSRYERLPDIDN